jgi:hypothetical protein
MRAAGAPKISCESGNQTSRRQAPYVAPLLYANNVCQGCGLKSIEQKSTGRTSLASLPRHTAHKPDQ